MIKYTVGRWPGKRGRSQGSGTSKISLVVYDLLGREVAVLVDEKKAPGSYEVSFSPAAVLAEMAAASPAVSISTRLTAGSFVLSRKMMFLK